MIAENMRKPSSSAGIVDLADELLIEIFMRLHTFITVVTNRCVCKRWLSLLSNPKFVIQFYNHKKSLRKQLTFLQQQQQHLPWTFLSMTRLKINANSAANTHRYYFPTHKVFRSPKFSLNFLPFQFKVVATFKDLVLCIIVGTSNDHDEQQYCVCNPLTKQWVVLPPVPATLDHPALTWACIICEDLYYNDNEERIDYRFRIVVVHPIPNRVQAADHDINSLDPYKVFSLYVFCSEDCKWRKIDLRVSLKLFPRIPYRYSMPFVGVVCKGMVCLRIDRYFGVFDPFDISPTTTNNGTLDAQILPLYLHGKILECGRRLIHISGQDSPTFVDPRNKMGGGFAIPMTIFQLNLNKLENNNIQVDPFWNRIFINCFEDKDIVISPPKTSSIQLIGMHPINRNLLYILVGGNEVMLCHMRSLSLKSLGTLHPDHLKFSTPEGWFGSWPTPRIELQDWPTPVPKILG